MSGMMGFRNDLIDGYLSRKVRLISPSWQKHRCAVNERLRAQEIDRVYGCGDECLRSAQG